MSDEWIFMGPVRWTWEFVFEPTIWGYAGALIRATDVGGRRGKGKGRGKGGRKGGRKGNRKGLPPRVPKGAGKDYGASGTWYNAPTPGHDASRGLPDRW